MTGVPEKNPLMDLVVIGTGMAGMAAALFAAKRGLATAHVGVAGQINFASGLLDLLGVHPVSEGRSWADPWAAMAQLVRDEPAHPYARLRRITIETALTEVLSFLAEAGLDYARDPAANHWVLTAAGTAKPTHAVPATMAPGCAAMADRRPCLVVGFEGLKGFSAHQIVEHQRARWPSLRAVRVRFAGLTGELYAEHMARSLENTAARRALAEAVRPHLGQESIVGFPAVLGVGRAAQVVSDLEALLGRTVFEIPLMVPAVTGLRLRQAFEQNLPAIGVTQYYQELVKTTERTDDGSWLLAVGREDVRRTLKARAVILATGRFLGKGLHADRKGIRETLMDLPVRQPAGRNGWHHKHLFHPAGHAVNRCGLATDAAFRPLNARGAAIDPHLFAAGTILADQDWVRQKCGSGLAIATAFGAVSGAIAALQAKAGPAKGAGA